MYFSILTVNNICSCFSHICNLFRVLRYASPRQTHEGHEQVGGRSTRPVNLRSRMHIRINLSVFRHIRINFSINNQREEGFQFSSGA